MKMMGDKELRNRQLGTATYIIDKLALRVGNDKDEDEADTVGCCSLRVEHLKLLPGNQVEFDFLGKDSMRYHNVVTVIPEVWNNIEIFMKKK
jgi:DNA topoisomerase-1